MDKKLGVYICTGCGIGESLDIDALKKVASKEFKAPVCKTHSWLCGTEGVEMIKADVAGDGVNTLSIVACSPRVKYDVFDFGPVLMDRVNIREQVAWVLPAGDEDTQMMAEDNMRMGLVKLNKSTPPEPYQAENLSKTVLVVGGGFAGMNAAVGAAQAGYPVLLVEKEANLGGFMNKMNKRIRPPYKELKPVDLEDQIKKVEAEPNIKIFTSAQIEKIAGGPGVFDVTISQNGSSTTERVGSVIQATGWKPYDANKLEHLGYGKFPNVITNVQMEEMAKNGKITRPSDGKEAKNVLFIQCAGSRDENHLAYCSSVCCLVSLKQATYVKEQDPEAAVYILYKDIRTPHQSEDFYRKVQKDGGIFIRGELNAISEDGNKNLSVEASDALLNETIQLEELDLVVLAVGMVPTSIDETALNLDYRQGPGLPVNKYGFPDSNFICFPYETQRTGIYTAGCVRSPMETAICAEDATGAALKTIQCIESTAIGSSTFPRSGDMTYPEFMMSRCTQCKRCTEECPFGAINEDEKANPLPNLTRCRRCGTCMGACPERIISFKNYSVDMIGSMIKGIEVPDADDEKPRVIALICENDAYPALDMAGINRIPIDPFYRFISVRCLGSVNLVWIADALAKGIDGVILLGCRKGDDYQCHFIKGSELANTRMEKISETLGRLALEPERVRVEEISINDYDRLPVILNDFMARIKELEPNPYKGF
ncbi:MAG: heterodisulfide reductase subunit A [Deltaproteobacteria bacterium RBG_13_43_22]|nr:MAG: heterodisulfide reductase subunit A [Deltaproteobacteria bacterium RBG_13_43_22]